MKDLSSAVTDVTQFDRFGHFLQGKLSWPLRGGFVNFVRAGAILWALFRYRASAMSPGLVILIAGVPVY